MKKTALPLSALCGFLTAAPALGQEATPTPLERFTFRGDILARGFYLERDLPLRSVSLNTTTKKSEVQDLYSMRYRLDLAFRPSQNVDVQYGLQVGELTFGRDTPSSTGHGSGGVGAGATNVETRELILKIRNNPESMSLSFGILNFDTPRGLVLASSGGGARLFFDLPSIASSIDVYYIRALDNSVIDGDSNGFSDKNFTNVNLGLARYRFTGIKGLRSEAYLIYRQDDDALSANDGRETSKLYWAGLFAQYKKGQYGLLFHAVGNWGTFHRPDPANPPLRNRRGKRAGAGQIEVSAQPWDELQITLVGAGASGRLGIEPNGSTVEYRQDQFRTVAGGFQLTDIVMDSSGGYTVFAAGKLTGVVAEGIQFKTTIDRLTLETGLYYFTLFRTPTIDYNAVYVRYPDMHRPNNKLGNEYNLKLAWRLLTDFTLDARAAVFIAKDGYRVLFDAKPGARIYEYSITMTQKY